MVDCEHIAVFVTSMCAVGRVMPDDHIHVDFSGEFESSRFSQGSRDRSPRSPSPFDLFRSPSPLEVNADTASISSCPEMVGPMVRVHEMKTKGKLNCFNHRMN